MHICSVDEAPALAAKMLGGTLVTKQVWVASPLPPPHPPHPPTRVGPPTIPCTHTSAGSVSLPPLSSLLTSPMRSCLPPRRRRSPPRCLQTGAKGKPVNTLYVANKMQLLREMYFAILLDRKSAGPVMIGCSEVRGVLRGGAVEEVEGGLRRGMVGKVGVGEEMLCRYGAGARSCWCCCTLPQLYVNVTAPPPAHHRTTHTAGRHQH